MVIGPYVKQGAVVSTTYDHASALKHLENMFGLDPLYGPGEIDTMLKGLDVRYNDLAANREKTSD